MTEQEFEQFLDTHPTINWQWVKDCDNHCVPLETPDDATHIAFSVSDYPFYDNGGMTVISIAALKSMSVDQLWDKLMDGVDVEQITRITGYFSKVNGWNQGKLGELRKRKKGMEVPMSCGFPHSQNMIGVCRN